MKVQIPITKTKAQWDDTDDYRPYEYIYDLDRNYRESMFYAKSKIKFPFEDILINQISSKRGVTNEFIKNNYSDKIKQIYSKKLNEYLIKLIVLDSHALICNYYQWGVNSSHIDYQKEYAGLEFDSKTNTIKKIKSYYDFIQEPDSENQNIKVWNTQKKDRYVNKENNHKYLDPFDFGDYYSIQKIENELFDLGNIELEIIIGGEVIDTFVISYPNGYYYRYY